MDIKSLIFFTFSLFLASTLAGQQWSKEDLDIYQTFDDIEPLLQLSNDTTYLINFWATWCGPCVKELPYFEQINARYKGEKFQTLLVSLDLERQIDAKLLPFLNKKEIQSKVLLLLDGKPNKWIDRVDPSWSGAIPITIIRKGDHYAFYEKEFHSEQELIDIVSPILNSEK